MYIMIIEFYRDLYSRWLLWQKFRIEIQSELIRVILKSVSEPTRKTLNLVRCKSGKHFQPDWIRARIDSDWEFDLDQNEVGLIRIEVCDWIRLIFIWFARNELFSETFVRSKIWLIETFCSKFYIFTSKIHKILFSFRICCKI